MMAPMRIAELFSEEKRMAAFFAVTASVARIETVIAVPMAMANTDNTPPKKRPFNSANDKTIMAPEQGRMPTARTADHACFKETVPDSVFGSGICA